MLNVAFVVCPENEVTAVFTGSLVTAGGWIGCYAHVGQHGTAHINWINEETRNATEEEREPLYRELMGIYECGDDAVTLWPVEWAYPAH